MIINRDSIKKLILIIGYISILNISYAESVNMYLEKEFLIILSTKDYSEALKVCREADAKLDYGIDLRDLEYNNKIGLTYSKEILEDEDNGGKKGNFPWYFPRGRYDDGRYFSIEYSNGYESFAKGYYIVIVESGEVGSLSETLKEVKQYYKNAYIKRAKIYMGCME